MMEKVLDGYLKELKLPSIREWYRDMAKEAKRENMGYEEYLLALVEKEREERGARRVEKMLKNSKLLNGYIVGIGSVFRTDKVILIPPLGKE